MKNVICILALFCIVYISKQNVADPTNNLERMVNLQKKPTEILLNELMFFEKKIKENLELKINDIKADTLLNLNNIINEAFKDINLSIGKGKKEGKKIDECYDVANNNLEMINKNANAELEMCIQNAEMTMEVPLQNVAKIIKATNILLTDLNTIIPNCYSSSILKTQFCVMKNLHVSRSSLKHLRTNAKDIIKTALLSYTVAINDVRSCTTKLVTNSRTSSIEFVVGTNICVRNALPSTPSTSSISSINTIPSV